MPPPNDAGFYSQSNSFYRVLTAAIDDLTEHGFDSAERVQEWIRRIREAALYSLIPSHIVDQRLQAMFRATYERMVARGGILKHHPGVSRFTLARVAPRLRAELDRRLMASADLIKLNRAAAIEKTTQRFSGWATSIPPGGTEAVSRVETKTEIRKALTQLPFEERRVAIDQGAKFISNLNSILASDGGAIAAEWHSHFRQAGYQFREEHKHFDGRVFVIRGNWALDKGLMRLDGAKYTDEVEQPAELPFCRCFYSYIYSLRSLPDGMLTEKGRAELARVKLTA